MILNAYETFHTKGWNNIVFSSNAVFSLVLRQIDSIMRHNTLLWSLFPTVNNRSILCCANPKKSGSCPYRLMEPSLLYSECVLRCNSHFWLLFRLRCLVMDPRFNNSLKNSPRDIAETQLHDIVFDRVWANAAPILLTTFSCPNIHA